MSVKDISKTKSDKTDTKTTEAAAGATDPAGQQEKTLNQVAYMNEYNRKIEKVPEA